MTYPSNASALVNRGSPVRFPLPPVGADAGRFNLPISCTVKLGRRLPLVRFPLNVDIQGVIPAVHGPGQDFYLTQGFGSITFPRWLTRLAPLAGIGKVDALVEEMNIGAVGATPAMFNIAEDPIRIDDIAIKAGQPLTVGLPLVGTFEIGPFTAPDSGLVRMRFAGARVRVKFRTPLGFSMRLTTECRATAHNALKATAVGGPTGQPPARFANVDLNPPPVERGWHSGTITAAYDGTLDDERFQIGVALHATLPLTVKKGRSLPVSDACGALIIPETTVNRLIDKGYRTATGRVTMLTIAAENAVPANRNVIPPEGLPLPVTTLIRDTPIIVPLPQDGTLNPETFTPVPGAKSMTFTLGDAAAEFCFNGSTTVRKVSCAAPTSPKVILTECPVR